MDYVCFLWVISGMSARRRAKVFLAKTQKREKGLIKPEGFTQKVFTAKTRKNEV